MNSKEIFENFHGSSDKGCGPEYVILTWILQKSMRNSFLWFVYKVSKLHDKTASGKKVAESFHSTVIARCLRPILDSKLKQKSHSYSKLFSKIVLLFESSK